MIKGIDLFRYYYLSSTFRRIIWSYQFFRGTLYTRWIGTNRSLRGPSEKIICVESLDATLFHPSSIDVETQPAKIIQPRAGSVYTSATFLFPALRSDRNMVDPAAIFSAVRLQPANSRGHSFPGFSPALCDRNVPMRHEDLRNAGGRAPLITAYPIILRYSDDISANRSPFCYIARRSPTRVSTARYTLRCGNIIPPP